MLQSSEGQGRPLSMEVGLTLLAASAGVFQLAMVEPTPGGEPRLRTSRRPTSRLGRTAATCVQGPEPRLATIDDRVGDEAASGVPEQGLGRPRLNFQRAG